MYCTFCGKQIADNAVFCSYCGKPTPQGDALAELVAAARIGDKDAVSTLYEQTYSKVYYTVKSMIKDEDAVFDIVQDTYIKAFAHLDGFQGDTKFLPWVRQIAANTARDWLKKKRPMLFAELNSGDGQDTPAEEMFPDERSENLPDQVIDQQETKRLIREIIEDLPEDQRAAIGMFYYEEMSVKEIAAAMGVSESAVKSRLMYGRNKIEKKVRELEKQGTKLYSLSPIPFLLLLFRNQKAYAVEAPDGRILQAVLASQPVGAATAAGTAQGTGAAGGLGALKIGLIAVTAVSVVGIGAFSVSRSASRSAEPQEPSAVEEVIDQDELEGPALGDGSEVTEESVLSGESEVTEESASIDQDAPEESAPIDEAMEQYRIILSQADSYEYETSFGFESVSYQYALIQMQPDDLVPTLLLEMDEEDWTLVSHVRVFQYDPDTKTVHQPTESIDGSIRGGLSMAGDGNGMLDTTWSGGTGQGSVTRITLDGDSLKQDTYWKGRIDQMPDSITFIEIEWHEIGDLSALDSWTASSVPKEEVVFDGPEDKNCTSYAVPDGVTKIGEKAFYGCKSLTSVEIPDSVTEIGQSAFNGCESLTSIEVPDGVTKIGMNAFLGCRGLTSIEIPDSVTEIGQSAFSMCTGLTSIEISAGMTEIGANVFSGCESLTSIEIPDGVTIIRQSAFSGCRSLTSVEIPDSVTEIGEDAFSSCTSLTSIEIPDGVTEIKVATFFECKSLTSVEIPDSVIEIRENAFSGCTGLTSIEIPGGVAKIRVGAFLACDSLASIKVPEGIDLTEACLMDSVEIIYY